MTTEQQKKELERGRIPSIYPGGRAAMLLQCRRRRRRRKRVESHLILLLSQIRFGGRRRRWGGRKDDLALPSSLPVRRWEKRSLPTRRYPNQFPPFPDIRGSSPARRIKIRLCSVPKPTRERRRGRRGYEARQAKARPQIGSYFFCSPPPIFFPPSLRGRKS